jgi:hypothetical protein
MPYKDFNQRREYNKKYKEENRDKELLRLKEYYYKNQAYYKQKQKEWRQNNKEHLKELKKQSYREHAIKYNRKYYYTHRDKRSKYGKLYYKKNKERIRDRNLQRDYNITFADKQRMYETQQGRCGICQKFFLITKLKVDHCHKTNHIRGLLCDRCNTSLGLMDEDIESLRNMIKYLENK